VHSVPSTGELTVPTKATGLPGIPPTAKSAAYCRGDFDKCRSSIAPSMNGELEAPMVPQQIIDISEIECHCSQDWMATELMGVARLGEIPYQCLWIEQRHGYEIAIGWHISCS